VIFPHRKGLWGKIEGPQKTAPYELDIKTSLEKPDDTGSKDGWKTLLFNAWILCLWVLDEEPRS